MLGTEDSLLMVGPLPPPPTGLAIAFATCLEGFRKRKLTVEVVDTNDRHNGRRTIGKFEWRRALQMTWILSAFLWKLLRTRRVYLLLAISRVGFARDLVIIWLSFFLRRHLILHIHSGGYGLFYERQHFWLQILIRATLARARSIIILSDLLCEQMSFLPRSSGLLKVVPNGLPCRLEAERPVAKRLDLAKPIRLLYLSNMIRSKGYLDVLEACRQLTFEKKIPVRCDFYGDFLELFTGSRTSSQEARQAFLQRIQQFRLTGIAAYHGRVTGAAKVRVLQKAHVLILPTRYEWEGQPVCIIEALAFGTPVIATPFRAIPDEVVDGYNGFLVDKQRPSAIADAVERLWIEPAKYQNMSLNARRHFERNFTTQLHLDRLQAIIWDSARTTKNYED